MCAQRNGPDWTDILSTLKNLEDTHGCAIVIHLWRAGRAVGGGMHVTVAAHQPEGMIDRLSDGPAVWDTWPNRTSQEVSDLVYRLLIELDYKCSRELWSQSKLPNT